MKTKTFELDGFVFELSVETLDHLLEHESYLYWMRAGDFSAHQSKNLPLFLTASTSTLA